MEAELTRKDSAPEEISAEPLMGGGGGQITAGMGRREVGREEGARPPVGRDLHHRCG